MTEKLKKSLPLIALAVVLLLGFAVRMYDLTEAPLDWNHIRQMRDTTIARSIYYQLLPNADPETAQQAHYLASLQEVFELPVLETLMAFLYLVFGELPWMVRIVNALAWCLGGWFIYAISKHYFPPWAAISALFFYLFLPFGVMTTRSFQPEGWMVMWILLSYLLLYRFTEKEDWTSAVLAGLAAGWAILIKPTALLYVGPAFASVVLMHFGWKDFWRNGKVWTMAALSILPIAIYSVFVAQSGSQHTDLWVLSMNEVRFSVQFYIDWMLNLKRLMGLTFVAAGVIGLLIAPRKLRSLLIGGWIGYILSGLVYPVQFATHDYYHIFIIPLITLSLLPLFDFVTTKLTADKQWFWRAAFTGVLITGAGIGFLDVKQDLDQRDFRPEAAAWAAIGEQIPADGCLLTLSTDYGLRLTYYGWRGTCRTWPAMLDFSLYETAGKGTPDYEGRFAESILGMDYFVVLSMEEWQAQQPLQALLVEYPLITEGDGFLVFDLR